MLTNYLSYVCGCQEVTATEDNSMHTKKRQDKHMQVSLWMEDRER